MVDWLMESPVKIPGREAIASKFSTTPDVVDAAIEVVAREEGARSFVTTQQVETEIHRRGYLTDYLRAAFNAQAERLGYRTWDEYVAHTLAEIVAGWQKDPRAAIAALKEANRLVYPEIEESARSVPLLSDDERRRLLTSIQASVRDSVASTSDT